MLTTIQKWYVLRGAADRNFKKKHEMILKATKRSTQQNGKKSRGYKKSILFLLPLFFIFSSIFSYAKEDLDKVTVQLDWVYQYQYAGFIAAKEKGYYKEVGLDVELKEYSPGIDSIAELMSQKANYVINNSSIVIDKGKVVPIVLLATYMQQSPLIFVSSPEIEHPHDFIGKRIMGTTDELRHSSLALLLRHFGITKNNAEMVEHTFKLDDFIEGRVDIISAFRSNQLYELDRQGVQYNIIDPTDFGFYMSAINLISSRDEVLEFPERAQKIIDASNRGWEYAIAHTDEIVDLIYNKYSKDKSKEALAFEAKVTREMMLVDFHAVGQVNGELSSRALKQLKQNKLIDMDGSLGTFLYNDVISNYNRDAIWTTPERQYLEKKKNINVCVDPGWMPFESINKNGQHIGVAADILKLIQTRNDIQFKTVVTDSWEESLEYAKARKCDIVSLIMETPSRKKHFNFTDPYIEFPFVIATRSEEIFIARIEDVLDKPLGMVKGYAFIEILEDRFPHINIIEVDNMLEGLNLLRKGEIFGFIDTLATIAYTIQKEGMVDVKISGKFDDEWALSVGTRSDEPILNSIMQKAIHSVSEKERREIYHSWFSVHFEKGVDYSLIYKIVASFFVLALFLAYRHQQLRKHNQELVKLSRTDPLTGLFNRMKLDELLSYHYVEFKRYGSCFCVIMIDIDNFKRINDTLGHQMGDNVLIQVATAINNNIRATDSIGRWGGEEFLVLSPKTNLAGASRQLEHIRRSVEREDFGLGYPVTISLGCAEIKPDENISATISRADRAMYRAKNSGRNRIEISSS